MRSKKSFEAGTEAVAQLLNVSKTIVVETCQTHGRYESRNLFGRIWSQCPACAEAERATADANAETERRRARKQAWAEKLGRAALPERFLDRTLKNYRVECEGQALALAFAEKYADEFDSVLAAGRCAIFHGNYGTGKTHLSVAIALRIMHRDNRRVLFSTVRQAIRSITETWNRNSKLTESQAIASLVEPDLLILDEVGVQFGNGTEVMIISDFMNERYNAKKPTLLLSNLTLPQIREYLGERAFERLRERGGQSVGFTWGSERGRL